MAWREAADGRPNVLLKELPEQESPPPLEGGKAKAKGCTAARRRRMGATMRYQSSAFPATDSPLRTWEEFESTPLPDEASLNTEIYESKQSDDYSTPEGNCLRCMWEDLPTVIPITHWDSLAKCLVYRADLPRAGIFQCSLTALSFQVKSAVTVTYRYDTWTRHLSEADWEIWVPAGPLFHIEVQQPGVVQAVHLPHFICLSEDVNTSLCSIAHFKSGEMTLETPTRLVAFSAILENPSFSFLGVLWRRLRSALNALPMHSSVLIFQQSNAANTFHFYLIPDDNSVKEAIKKEEMKCESKFIPKPPPFRPLFFGCNYQVTTTKPAEITPQTQLPFYYKSPEEQQLFVEIYIENMAKEIGLLMTDTRDGTEIWKASLRSGDANLPARVSRRGAAFMKKHRTRLCSRMGQLSTILMYLRDANIITSDEEEEVQRQDMKVKKNQFLLKLVEKKGLEAQEQLYQILCRQDPWLMEDLELN